MSAVHFPAGHPQRHHRPPTPWLPHPSLVDVVGHLALVARYLHNLRKARA